MYTQYTPKTAQTNTPKKIHVLHVALEMRKSTILKTNYAKLFREAFSKTREKCCQKSKIEKFFELNLLSS